MIMKMNRKEWEYANYLNDRYDEFEDLKKHLGYTIGEMFMATDPSKFRALQNKWEQAIAKEGWE